MIDNTRIRQLFKTGILLGVIAVPLIIWLQSTGYSFNDLRVGGLPGQNYYLLSKLLGLYAIILLAMQVVYGLSRLHVSRFHFLRWTQTRHRLLGILTLVLILIHVSLFILAVSIRKQAIALELLLPHFSDFYSTILSLGWLSLVFVLCAVLVRLVQHGLGDKRIWIHRLVVPAVFLSLFHAFLIGSEFRVGLLFYVYVGLFLLLILALMKRLRVAK